MSGQTPQALAGLRVLEVGDEKSPLTGTLLADMGADVVLIEPREGSRCRRGGPFYGDVPTSTAASISGRTTPASAA